MSRFVDRIIAGCQPCRASLMIGREKLMHDFRAEAQKELGPNCDEETLSAAVRGRIASFCENDPVARKPFDLAWFKDAPVFAADDVAAYAQSLPNGTVMSDVVASMAPPFERFFVEFQKIPNRHNLYAWGALVEATDDPTTIASMHSGPTEGIPRWVLILRSFLEREKGKPFGPVADHMVGLAEDGTWFRHPDGNVWWAGGPVEMDGEPPHGFVQYWGDFIAILLFPVLLTISFMHCKNVEVRHVVPPDKLSRKHRKEHGHDLTRYHVLDIQPIRRILDRHSKGDRDDLRRALHICRGHFKTFTPDAPLMGRHVGTYWWAPQVRGSQEQGTVLKDYRVNALRALGRSYREADENASESEREAPPAKDPDSQGRGLSAHNRTQNQIAEFLRQIGIEPLSPTREEPEFDVAWKLRDTYYVCEVKSITSLNEERQLRMAIGQVIRYRQKLAACGHEPICAVVAAEQRPSDASWQDLCDNEGILLLWPDVVQTRLNALSTAEGNRNGPCK